MTDSTLNPDQAAARARALLEADVNTRVDAVRQIATAALNYETADAALKDAGAAHDRAWTAALATGWTAKDLRAAGLRPPAHTPPRVRKPRTRTDNSVAPSDG